MVGSPMSFESGVGSPMSFESGIGSSMSFDPGSDGDKASVKSVYFEAKEDVDESNSSEAESSKPSPEERKRQKALEGPFLVRFRQRVGNFVNNSTVQLIVIFLIILNAIFMGVGTFDFVTENPKVSNAFENVDLAFLSIFTVELCLQFIYWGMHLFLDGWLVFDFVIILLSWSFNSLQVIRAFRIFRAFRLVTRVKTLRDLVTAIVSVLPRMAAICCLLLLIFYIFGVLFTELFKDLELTDNAFKTLDASLFTCFQMMTMEWADLARECMEYYDWAWIPFVSFILASGFIVFNLIIAVVCDAVAVAEEMSREMDGTAEEAPEVKLYQAQERINKLGNRIADMLDTQKDMQDLLQELATEIHNLQESSK